jgi:hypothetical protein
MSAVRVCLLSLSLFVVAAPAHSDDKTAASDMFDLFAQACLQDPGNPDSTRAWATSHNLTVLTNPRGIQVFAGGPGGAAWQTLEHGAPLVLSIRAVSGVCAVFVGSVDTAALSSSFERLIASLSTKFGPSERLPDRTAAGQFGMRTQKVVMEQVANHKLRIFTLVTDERPGGAFQATLQVGGGPG